MLLDGNLFGQDRFVELSADLQRPEHHPASQMKGPETPKTCQENRRVNTGGRSEPSRSRIGLVSEEYALEHVPHSLEQAAKANLARNADQGHSLAELPGCLGLHGLTYELTGPEAPAMLLRKQSSYNDQFRANIP